MLFNRVSAPHRHGGFAAAYSHGRYHIFAAGWRFTTALEITVVPRSTILVSKMMRVSDTWFGSC
jgi:hypothetical protein